MSYGITRQRQRVGNTVSIQVNGAREQIDRLVHSKTFETSDVHRRLLQYLAEKTLAGEADRLKEYVIGLEAFGKPPTYDPKQDSIVRLQVGRLRQKLAAYYQTESPADPVLVSVPKGAFRLTFEAAPPAGPVREPRLTPRTKRAILAACMVALTAWATVATVWLVRLRADDAIVDERWNPELESLWSPFIQSKRPLLVCLGTPLFLRFPNFGFFRDPKANDWDEIEKSERVAGVRRALGDKDVVPSYHFTGSGEAGAAFLIAQVLSPRKRGLLLTPGNLISWQQIKDDDVVFVGPPKFNRQLQAAALTRDIVIEPGGVRNLKPQPGEPVYLPDMIVAGKPSEGETHAVISRTAGLSGKGELLVIAGNASPDTFGAAEWLTDPARARELARRLRQRNGELPRYFQIVIKVAFKQGIPVQSSYVFHHVL
jgi:hypothetical protein